MSPGYAIEFWPNTQLIKFIMNVVDESGVPEGWGFRPFSDGPPSDPVEGPLTPEEEVARKIAILDTLKSEAETQKAALTTRIGVLQESVDYGMATPKESVELTVRTSQRVEWGRYAVLLGRVTTQSGWYASVEWPAKPAQRMEVSTSSVAMEDVTAN